MKHNIRNILISDSWKLRLLTITTVAIILLIRRTDAFIIPQFWAEDGLIFFLQQYEKGALAIFQPYAGYLHLVPRLIACFSDSFFAYSAIPFFYNLLSFILTLFVVIAIFSPRFKINYKPLLALTIVLVPHYNNEVFMNITNLQSILFLLLIILLMKEEPNLKYGNIKIQIALDIIIIIFCGLTGPFIIFLIPLFAWKWIKNQSIYNFSIIFVVVVISFIQLLFILSALAESNERSIILNVNVYSALVGYKIFGNLFLGKSITYKINPYLLSIMYLGVIITILRLSTKNNKFVIYFISIHLIILLTTVYRFKVNPEVLIPIENGPRYFYIPYVMVTWSLITLLGQREKWKNALISIGLILILISSLTSGFHSRFIEYNWGLNSKLIGKKDIEIPINPKGWQIYIKARQ